MKKTSKGHYTIKLDQLHKPEGLFELWEHDKYGDEAEALVTLNGEIVGFTWDNLHIFYEEDYLI